MDKKFIFNCSNPLEAISLLISINVQNIVIGRKVRIILLVEKYSFIISNSFLDLKEDIKMIIIISIIIEGM